MTDDLSLAYRNRWLDYDVSHIDEDTTNDSVLNELIIPPSVKTSLALIVTGEEYNKLFAALSLGVDLLYSEDADQLKWLLWKAAKDMNFCDTVANCIGNSENVIEALTIYNQTIVPGGYNDAQPLAENVLDTDLALVGCSDDELWGSCQAIVDGVFDATFEILQRVKLAGTQAELVNEVLDAIPIIGGLLSFAFDLGVWMADTAYDLFVAVDSAPLRADLSCDLFCATKDNCEVTMNDVTDVFSENAISQPPFALDIRTNLEWMVEVAFTGEPDKKVASTIAMLGTFALRYGGKVGQLVLGIFSLQQQAAMGAIEKASNTWEILCDECIESWEETFNLRDEIFDFAFTDSGQGVWQMGQGAVAETFRVDGQPNLQNTAVRDLELVFDIPQLTFISFDYTITKGIDSANTAALKTQTKETNDDVTTFLQNHDDTDNGTGTWTYEFAERDIVWIKLLIRSQARNEEPYTPTGSGTIHSVTLKGLGSNPFD